MRSTKKKVSQSFRAGLLYPVGRIGRLMRKNTAYSVSADAPVFMAAAIEYVCAELLDIAGEVCKKNGQRLL